MGNCGHQGGELGVTVRDAVRAEGLGVELDGYEGHWGCGNWVSGYKGIIPEWHTGTMTMVSLDPGRLRVTKSVR